MKKLSLSTTDKKIAGVCGGIAEYFHMDSTIMRLIWILFLAFFRTPLIIFLYFILWAILPTQE